MTRTHAWTATVLALGTLALSATVPQSLGAQQQRQCSDISRQRQAVNLARAINSAEIASFQSTQAFHPLSAFPEITIPAGFQAQLIADSTGAAYVFSVKDTQDPCRYTVFSDQEQLIYTAQPLR
jgi:hypothetical protein